MSSSEISQITDDWFCLERKNTFEKENLKNAFEKAMMFEQRVKKYIWLFRYNMK